MWCSDYNFWYCRTLRRYKKKSVNRAEGKKGSAGLEELAVFLTFQPMATITLVSVYLTL